jgi:hypothetical protein
MTKTRKWPSGGVTSQKLRHQSHRRQRFPDVGRFTLLSYIFTGLKVQPFSIVDMQADWRFGALMTSMTQIDVIN